MISGHTIGAEVSESKVQGKLQWTFPGLDAPPALAQPMVKDHLILKRKVLSCV